MGTISQTIGLCYIFIRNICDIKLLFSVEPTSKNPKGFRSGECPGADYETGEH